MGGGLIKCVRVCASRAAAPAVGPNQTDTPGSSGVTYVCWRAHWERERDRARQRKCECRIIVVPDNVRVCSGNNFGSANVFGGPVQLISSGGQFLAGQCSAVILNRSWVRREGGGEGGGT